MQLFPVFIGEITIIGKLYPNRNGRQLVSYTCFKDYGSNEAYSPSPLRYSHLRCSPRSDDARNGRLYSLELMQENTTLQHIPVIVVSGAEDQETSIRAMRAGATDFVTKPFDPEVLRARVSAAVNKAEVEKLRAKNSMLEYQNGEIDRLKSVLKQHGIEIPE